MTRILLTLLALVFGFSAAAEARQMEEMNFAVLRTIDKISARTRTFEVPVDKTVKFGSSLFIRLRACRKASPLDQPENAAFLQIWEKKPTEEKSNWVFSGWMFSSNPSLSAMDHPVYDVWVIECKNAATSAKQEFSSEKAPEGAPAKGAVEPGSDTPSPAAVAEPVPVKEDKVKEDKSGDEKPADKKPEEGADKLVPAAPKALPPADGEPAVESKPDEGKPTATDEEMEDEDAPATEGDDAAPSEDKPVDDLKPVIIQ